MNVLILEDAESRIKHFRSTLPFARITDNVPDFLKILDTEDHWDYMFLDHDLGGEMMVDSQREDCGMEVVRQLKELQKPIRQIVVHSHNSPAAEAMVGQLKLYGYSNSIAIPYNKLKEILHFYVRGD